MEWDMREIKEDEIPTCSNAKDVIDYTLTIVSNVMPNTFNIESTIEGFRSTKMNDCQIAYSVSKLVYEQFYEMADNECKKECENKGIVLKRGDKNALDAWSNISMKCDNKYYNCELMSIKNQAEVMMVNYMFNALDNADEKIKAKYTQDMDKFEYIKTHWNHPAVRKQVIDLAFKFKLN